MPTLPRFNRREHERYRLNAMYTSISVEPKMSVGQEMLGHAYDISESGVRIELDEPLEPGQSVNVRMELPGAEQQIRTDADVIWVNDDQDDPGPRRMALRFKKFQTPMDQQRLRSFLGCGLQHLVA